jgi:glycosyltransferase involved in cell wall biosynthesis
MREEGLLVRKGTLRRGVAVVGTKVDGVSYLADHGKRELWAPPQDPVAMADTILALSNDSAEVVQTKGSDIRSVQQINS